MSIKIFPIILFIFSFLISGVSIALGQDNRPITFVQLPEPSQTQIRERLNLYMQYHKTQNWKKLYEILYEKRSRSTFIKDQTPRPNDGANFILQNFTPKYVILPDESISDWYIVEGCALIKEGKAKRHYQAIINAVKIGDIWKFSMIEFVRQVGSKPEQCKK